MMHFRKNILLGCIAEDLLGSSYAHRPYEIGDENLLNPDATFSDETLFAIAVADALLAEKCVIKRICHYFGTYATKKFTSPFLDFLIGGDPYAMNLYSKPVLLRFIPIPYIANSFCSLPEISQTVLDATKNDGGSLQASRFITTALYLCICGYRKNDIKNTLDHYFPGYRHTQTLEKLRKCFRHPLHAQFIAPLAFQAFMESDSYEHAIRNALEIGVSPKALASLSAAFAMAYYQEMPQEIAEFTLMRLPMSFVEIALQFQERFVLN